MEEIITLAEASELLGVSGEAVRRLYMRGTLAGVRKGGRLYFRRLVVDKRLQTVGYGEANRHVSQQKACGRRKR